MLFLRMKLRFFLMKNKSVFSFFIHESRVFRKSCTTVIWYITSSRIKEWNCFRPLFRCLFDFFLDELLCSYSSPIMRVCLAGYCVILYLIRAYFRGLREITSTVFFSIYRKLGLKKFGTDMVLIKTDNGGQRIKTFEKMVSFFKSKWAKTKVN